MAGAQTEVVEYYGLDALGSVRVVFDGSGVVVARSDYLPFGENLNPSGALPPWQFTGQVRDGEAGQDDFGARRYQPRHGRFTAVDPVYAGLFDPQQWNRYGYARNSPLVFVDPDGREVDCPTAYCEVVNVVGTLPPPPTKVVAPTSPSTTSAAAEGIAAMNNSCSGEGNSRACGRQNVAFTVSFSGGYKLLNVEVGMIVVVDADAGTATEYSYVAAGPGVGAGIGPASGTVNLETGLVDKGADLSGMGWQINGVSAAAMSGATGNVMGTLGWGMGPGWNVLGVSGGYAAGLGASVSAMVTYTKLTGVYDLRTLPSYLKRLLEARP
jgi:RHS repeat-associated protein